MNRIQTFGLVAAAASLLALPALAAKDVPAVAVNPVAAEAAPDDAGREARRAERAARFEARKAHHEAMREAFTAADFDPDAIRALAAEAEAERADRRAERLEKRIERFAAMTPEERVAAWEEGGRRRGKGRHGMRGEGHHGKGGEGHGKRHRGGDCE